MGANKKFVFGLEIMITGLLFLFVSGCSEDDVVSLPVVYIDEIANKTLSTATFTVNIISDGGYPITAQGVCYCEIGNPPVTEKNPKYDYDPTVDDNKTNDSLGNSGFQSQIRELKPNMIYHVRAYATNSTGTGYSLTRELLTSEAIKDINFNPDSEYGTVTDIDGNTYKTVKIGNQTWMAENLKTTKFNDGTTIPEVSKSTKWREIKTAAYCWYNNESMAYSKVYGALYNWKAIQNTRLCPTGWHVPTLYDQQKLISCLSGSKTAGGKLKETGNFHWLEDIEATNSSGFTALPGSYRGESGQYFELGRTGCWWSSTPGLSDTKNDACCLYLVYSSSTAFIVTNMNKNKGLSIRCVKD